MDKNNPLREFSNIHNEFNMVETDVGALLYAGNKLIPPRSARKELLAIAHTTHLGEEVIWSNIRKIWHWPSMRDDWRSLYERCSECQENRRAKNKNSPVLPLDLMFFGPGEYFTTDLFDLDRKDYFTVTDRLSGLILSERLKNKLVSL